MGFCERIRDRRAGDGSGVLTPVPARMRGRDAGIDSALVALTCIVIGLALVVMAGPAGGASRSAAPRRDADAVTRPARARGAALEPRLERRADITAPYRSGAFTRKWRESAFLRASGDDAGHVSYRIGALKLAPPARPWVALIGGSNVRECLEEPTDLRDRLESLTGVRTTVLQLGSTNQNFGETMAIVANLPPGPGVVVIAVNHTRFAYPPRIVRQQIGGITLLMPSTPLWEFILGDQGTAPADTIAPGVRAYWDDWRRRNADVLAAGGTPRHVYDRHRYRAGDLWALAKKRSRVQLWLDGRGAPGAEFDQNSGFNARLLAAIGGLAADRGYRLVLMEASQDLSIVGTAFDRYKAVYVPVCEQIAVANGGPYIDFNADAGLVRDDFRDLTHLVGAGRTKWTRELARALAPVVSGLVMPAAAPAPTDPGDATE